MYSIMNINNKQNIIQSIVAQKKVNRYMLRLTDWKESYIHTLSKQRGKRNKLNCCDNNITVLGQPIGEEVRGKYCEFEKQNWSQKVKTKYHRDVTASLLMNESFS